MEAVISGDGASLQWQKEATMRMTDGEVQRQLLDAERKRLAAELSNESYTLRVMVIRDLARPLKINGSHARQLFTDTVWHRCELVLTLSVFREGYNDVMAHSSDLVDGFCLKPLLAPPHRILHLSACLCAQPRLELIHPLLELAPAFLHLKDPCQVQG